MERQIGAQFYTLRDHIGTVEDFEDTCKRVRDIGYRLIQISGTPLPADAMKPVIDRYGLKVVATHMAYGDFAERLSDVIAYNRTLECELCGIGSMPEEYRHDLQGITDFVEGINNAAKRLREEGLYLGYHNHAFEFTKYDGRFIMDRLIDETDPDNVKFIVDTYWLQFGGMNPEAFIRRLGERAMAVHFKDLKANADNSAEMAEIGQGNLDWDGIIKACDQAGTRWALVEQDYCRRDPFESLKMSYEYLCTKGFY